MYKYHRPYKYSMKCLQIFTRTVYRGSIKEPVSVFPQNLQGTQCDNWVVTERKKMWREKSKLLWKKWNETYSLSHSIINKKKLDDIPFHSIQFKLQMKFHVSEWVSLSFLPSPSLSFFLSFSLSVLCSALLLAWSNSIQFNSIQFNSIQFNSFIIYKKKLDDIPFHSIQFKLQMKFHVSEWVSLSFIPSPSLSFFLSLSLCPLLCSLACLIQFNSIQFNSIQFNSIQFNSILLLFTRRN